MHGKKFLSAKQKLQSTIITVTEATPTFNMTGGNHNNNNNNEGEEKAEEEDPDTIRMYDKSYSDSGHTKEFTGLTHLLFVWKSSVYKLIWVDMLLFALAYALLSILYRHIIFPYPSSREGFEVLCVYANKFGDLIPIAFLTGFYVSQVVARWWDQFVSLPWPEKLAYKLVAFIPGKDDFHRTLRITVMRYVNLSSVLSYRMVSTKIKDRFPTYKSLVDADLLLPHEVEPLRQSSLLSAPFESSSLPVLWAIKLLERARTTEKMDMDTPTFGVLISSFDYLQDCNRKILNYGWMKFPLAYTQVAKWAVGIYFFAALFGRQYLIPRMKDADMTFPNINVTYSNTVPFNNHTPDLYFPIFTFVELLCYTGWIKVADALLNPFGDDDQDFQVNYLIDRNLKVSYRMVDDDATNSIYEATDPFLDVAGKERFSGDFFAAKWKKDGWGKKEETTVVTDM